MSNDPLSRDDILDVLLEPQRWSIISTLCPPDVRPIDGSRYPVAQQVAAVHSDPCPQIDFFLQGTGGFTIDSVTYPLRPGSIFLINPYQLHGYEFDEPLKPGDLYRVNVLQGYYLVRFWSHRNGTLYGSSSQDELLTDTEAGVILDKHWAGLRDSVLSEKHIHTRIVAAITLLASALAQRHLGQEKRDLEDFQQEVVDAVRRHIAESMNQKHSLGELARIAGYSRFHFARIFRTQTGQSIHDYIDTCRLSKVRDLTLRGLTLKEIAAELGFSSPNAFARWRRDQRAKGNTL
jgi:AraC-like DNA-binding protein